MLHLKGSIATEVEGISVFGFPLSFQSRSVHLLPLPLGTYTMCTVPRGQNTALYLISPEGGGKGQRTQKFQAQPILPSACPCKGGKGKLGQMGSGQICSGRVADWQKGAVQSKRCWMIEVSGCKVHLVYFVLLRPKYKSCLLVSLQVGFSD